MAGPWGLGSLRGGTAPGAPQKAGRPRGEPDPGGRRDRGRCDLAALSAGAGRADTATLSGRTLRSPLGYGFALGGAFSPDGRQLAVFVNRSPGTGGGTVQLAIVSTRTGAMRLVPRARFLVGEDVGWARWLPGGKQLIAGGVDRGYIVTTASRTARPLRFRRSPRGDIGYSAVILPPRGPASQGAGRGS